MRQLRQVLEICRVGSITRAARNLGISQPTLSSSIRRIEDQVGVTLFETRGRGIAPNALAQHIASRAAVIIDNAANVGREVRAIASGYGAPLRIGVGAASRHLFDRDVLRDLLAAAPHLRIEMQQDVVPNLVHRARASELDVIITSHRRGGAPRELSSRPLIEDDVYFVARAGHPLSTSSSAGIEDFLNYPLASPGLYDGFQRTLPADLSDEQLRNATAYVCQDYHSIFDMVLASDSITYAPWYIIERLCSADRFVVLNSKVNLSYHSHIFTNDIAESSPFICRSVEIIRQSILRDHRIRTAKASAAKLAFGIAEMSATLPSGAGGDDAPAPPHNPGDAPRRKVKPITRQLD